MKIPNIDRESLHIFWMTRWISMKFSGKVWLMIISRATKKQSFTLSLEDKFLEKPLTTCVTFFHKSFLVLTFNLILIHLKYFSNDSLMNELKSNYVVITELIIPIKKTAAKYDLRVYFHVTKMKSHPGMKFVSAWLSSRDETSKILSPDEI